MPGKHPKTATTLLLCDLQYVEKESKKFITYMYFFTHSFYHMILEQKKK